MNHIISYPNKCTIQSSCTCHGGHITSFRLITENGAALVVTLANTSKSLNKAALRRQRHRQILATQHIVRTQMHILRSSDERGASELWPR